MCEHHVNPETMYIVYLFHLKNAILQCPPILQGGKDFDRGCK